MVLRELLSSPIGNMVFSSSNLDSTGGQLGRLTVMEAVDGKCDGQREQPGTSEHIRSVGVRQSRRGQPNQPFFPPGRQHDRFHLAARVLYLAQYVAPSTFLNSHHYRPSHRIHLFHEHRFLFRYSWNLNVTLSKVILPVCYPTIFIYSYSRVLVFRLDTPPGCRHAPDAPARQADQ
jgi:hypothetical protein